MGWFLVCEGIKGESKPTSANQLQRGARHPGDHFDLSRDMHNVVAFVADNLKCLPGEARSRQILRWIPAPSKKGEYETMKEENYNYF